jgi:hypothetical protein
MLFHCFDAISEPRQSQPGGYLTTDLRGEVVICYSRYIRPVTSVPTSTDPSGSSPAHSSSQTASVVGQPDGQLALEAMDRITNSAERRRTPCYKQNIHLSYGFHDVLIEPRLDIAGISCEHD